MTYKQYGPICKQQDSYHGKLKPQDINENIKEFSELTLEDQKRFLIECLDKNLLYVPYSEINNEEFDINQNDKSLNSDFYSIK